MGSAAEESCAHRVCLAWRKVLWLEEGTYLGQGPPFLVGRNAPAAKRDSI